jgi:hypothetical protein
LLVLDTIVIKPGPGVDLARGLTWPRGRVPGFMGQPESTQKNFKNIFKVLIFHMKKLRKNPCEYKLYM